MKKSKFLLLGSVASLASIPFVAAKCGETKEEKEARNWLKDQKLKGEST
nr:variable surface lipoprotein [Mycoplasmopsis bovis]